jgi:hypothetical protein
MANLTNFNAAVAAIAKAADVPIPQVVANETTAILTAAAKFTPAATAAAIRKREGERQFLRVGGKTYFLKNHFPNALWRTIARKQRTGLQRRLSRRGLAKASWAGMGAAVGLQVEMPAYARKAGDSVNHSENFSGHVVNGGRQLTLTNAQPTIVRIGGGQYLRRAIAGRVKYAARNLEKGVFDSFDTVARAYPGLRLNRSAT